MTFGRYQATWSMSSSRFIFIYFILTTLFLSFRAFKFVEILLKGETKKSHALGILIAILNMIFKKEIMSC